MLLRRTNGHIILAITVKVANNHALPQSGEIRICPDDHIFLSFNFQHIIRVGCHKQCQQQDKN